MTTRPRKDRSHSLKWHLIVLGLGLVMPTIIFVGIVLLRYSWSETEHTRQQAEQLARDLAVAVDREISSITTTLEALALAPSLSRGDLAEFYGHATAVRRAQGIDITLRDPDGVGIATTRLPFGERITGNPEALKEADRITVATGRYYASDLVVGVISGRPALHLMVPASLQGKRGYVVSASIVPERVREVLANLHHPAGWTTAALDRQGSVIARTPEPDQDAARTHQSFAATKGSFYGTDSAGVPTFFAYDTSDISGWHVVVRIAQTSLEEPMRQSIGVSLALAVALGVLTWLVTKITANRILSAIGAVSYSAHRIGAGTIVQAITTPITELNAISTALEEASTSLRQRELQRDAIEIVLRESEARYRMLHESLRDAFVKVGMDGRIIECNATFRNMVGYTSEELSTLTYVDLTPERWHAFEQSIVRDQILARGYSDVYEKEYRRKDGTIFPIELRTILSRDANGQPESMWALVRDITARKEIAARMEVLVAELQHRTRNLIAVVRSIGNQTMSNATSLKSFWEEFGHRLGALSRVQGLLSRSDNEPVTIGDLVRGELDALGTTDGRVTLEGPEVPLKNSAVQTLALALHELATNARKFGALAAADGTLQIKWNTRENGGDAFLVLEWTERRPTPTEAQAPLLGLGYGRELIERALPYALGAKTVFDLSNDGVHCKIELPITTTKNGHG